MRIGVVGLGYWGSRHVRVLCGMPEVESVIGFDADPARSSLLGAVHERFRSAPSFEGLLREVDGVVVATGASTHFAIASAALREGIHVLVEKPFVMRYADGLHLERLAESSGGVIVIGHTFVFDPAVRAVRDAVRSGRLGRIRRIASRRVNVMPGAADCDVIWDLAPHDFSICDYVLGASPSAVRAVGHREQLSGVLDDVHIDLDYGSSSVEGFVHVSWRGAERVRRLEVVGEEATMIYDDSQGDHRIALLPGRPARSGFPPAAPDRQGLEEEVRLEQPETLLLVDRHFVECMSQRRSSKSGVALGLAVTAALEATSRAAVTGERTAVRAVPRRDDLVLTDRVVSST